MSPRNASENAWGLRSYEWNDGVNEPTTVLSVTSVNSLNGVPYNLNSWQISNVLNAAMGTRRVTKVGPRGGVKEIYVPDGAPPGEFVRRMKTATTPEAIAELRAWTRAAADEPRDVAAVRGTIVHELIELGVKEARINEDYIRAKFADQWQQEKRKSKPAVLDDDVNFVINAMKQYEDMRQHVPFVVLAREAQCWNLSAGYAGTLDTLIWFLPPNAVGKALPQRPTLRDIQNIGGTTSLWDWKTSKDVHTDAVVQAHAYLSTEFVGSDGVVDERLTEILRATVQGAICHIRPNQWRVLEFDFQPAVLRAFLGRVASARMIAAHPTPNLLFSATRSGSAPDTDPTAEEVPDDS